MVEELALTLQEKNFINDETAVFIFTVKKKITFVPGQYLIFKLDNGKEKKPRAYSILSHENDGTLHFLIHLISNGFASDILRNLKQGDEITATGPLGHFNYADDENEEAWFVGVGTGVAPLLSMIRGLFKQKTKKRIVLLFGAKTKNDLFFHQQLLEMEKEHANFTYYPSLTREEWSGRTGRVQHYLPEDIENKTFYICGMKELVLDVKEILIKKGVKEKDIRFERYS